MKWITLLLISFLFILSCKKTDTGTGIPPPTNPTDTLPDALTADEIQTIENAGVDSLSTFSDALFSDGSNIGDWLSKNDSGYAYAFDGKLGVSPSSEINLFIGRLTKAGCQLINDKLYSFPSQPNGIAYVYGSRSIKQPSTYPNAKCQQGLYGIDCSGMIYLMAKASGVPISVGNTTTYTDTSTWNAAFKNSTDFTNLAMADLGRLSQDDIIAGDIIVAPGHHMGMIFKSVKESSLGVLNSLGSPDSTCASNSNSRHGAIITKNVAKWFTDLFKSGYHVLRVFQKDLPVVTTSIFVTLTQTQALCSGNIISDGGSPIIAGGICWGTHPNPTIVDKITSNVTSVGIFSDTLSNLIAYPAYFARAYATNSTGTTYGNEISFKPLADSTFTDARDGQVYRFRHIGSQVWMTENLRYDYPDSSWCYDDDNSNCSIYGRLYNWTAAKSAPPGWHLPSTPEWGTLFFFLNQVAQVDHGALKDTIKWNYPNSATNLSGFSALPGGFKYDINSGSTYSELGIYCGWWLPEEFLGNGVVLNVEDGQFTQGSSFTQGYGPKGRGLSVRCVKDQ